MVHVSDIAFSVLVLGLFLGLVLLVFVIMDILDYLDLQRRLREQRKGEQNGK